MIGAAQFVALAFALGLAIGGGGAWHYTAKYFRAEAKAATADALAQAIKLRADADAAMQSVVDWYEGRRKAGRVRHGIIRQEVERIVERPVYRDCVVDPDGVRLFNDAAADRLRLGDPDGEPRAMSPAGDPASGAGDNGRPIESGDGSRGAIP